MPIWRITSGVIAGVALPMWVSTRGPRPHRQATGMPWMLPDGVASAVLKSECASSHSTRSCLPVSRQWSATALIELGSEVGDTHGFRPHRGATVAGADVGGNADQ